MVMTLPAASVRFVIDTDVGVDDAVAIMLALHAFPREAVLGITTVFGNVDLHQANHNVAQYVQRLICAYCLGPMLSVVLSLF